MSIDQAEPGANHAWRYFEFHAAQRITVFNYYVAASGLLATGIAIVLLGDPQFSYLGIVAGLLLLALSFLFWKFDQRVSGMIKLSEIALERYEEAALEGCERIFCTDRQIVENSSRSYFRLKGLWTYGMAFRLIFLLIGSTGMLGAALAAKRYLAC